MNQESGHSRETSEQLDEITEMIVALARLDFSVVAKARGQGPLDAVAVGLRALREELKANVVAREEAESASLAKSAFLANISHELRTPLTTLRGNAELLHKGLLNADQALQVQHIMRSAQALTRLINDLLDVSKIAEGTFRIENKAFSLTAMLESIIESHAPEFERRGLILRRAFRGLPERPLWGDRDRLEQVLHNLLSNAAKFTDQGWIELSAEGAVDGETVCLSFSVKDSGSGISEAQREVIFERFVTRADKNDGLGLGLDIARSLVRELGGELELQSELDRGSTFAFSVRLAMAKPGAAETHEAPKEALPANILIVDDDELVRTTIQAMLEELGYAPVCASSGQEALEAAGRDAFDLILMDCQMPSMSGLEATRQLLARYPEQSLKIVAVTADATMEGARESQRAGMCAHLSKPFSMNELETLIADVLRERLCFLTSNPGS